MELQQQMAKKKELTEGSNGSSSSSYPYETNTRGQARLRNQNTTSSTIQQANNQPSLIQQTN